MNFDRRGGISTVVGLIFFLGVFFTAFTMLTLYTSYTLSSYREIVSEDLEVHATMVTPWFVATREFDNNSGYTTGVFVQTWRTDSNYQEFIEYDEIEAIEFGTLPYRIDVQNTFEFDTTKYPLERLSDLAIGIRYILIDNNDLWYLWVYDTDLRLWDLVIYLPSDESNVWYESFQKLGEDFSRYVTVDGNRASIELRLTDYILPVGPSEGIPPIVTTFGMDFLGVRGVLDVLNITITNTGSETVHVIAIWVQNETHHKRYEVDIYLEPGRTETSYTNSDLYNVGRQAAIDFGWVYTNGETTISWPPKEYVIKVVTDRGNIFSYIGRW